MMDATYRMKDMLDMMLDEPQNEPEYGTSLTPTIEPSTIQSDIHLSQALEPPFNSEEYNKLEHSTFPTNYREHRKTKQLQPPPSSPQNRLQFQYSQQTHTATRHLNEQQEEESFISQVLQTDDLTCSTSLGLSSANPELAPEKFYPGDVSEKMGEEQQEVNVDSVFQSQGGETTPSRPLFHKPKEEGYSDTESVEQGFGLMSVNSSQLEQQRYEGVLAEESSPKAVRGKEEENEIPKTRKKSIACDEGTEDSYERKRRKSVPTLVPMTKGTSPPIINVPSFDEKRKLPLKSESIRRSRRASVPVVISRGLQEPFLPQHGGYPLSGNLSAEEIQSIPSPAEGEEEEAEEIRMPQIKVTRSGKRRLKWTAELSELFTKAVEKLGPGAVPSAILDEMGVQGLTRGNISSHLQKYRLEMRQLQLQKQAEEEHMHFNQFHFNHPEAFLDSQGKRTTKLQYPPLAAPSAAGSYHYQYDPLLHASDLYPAPEDLNSFMSSSAAENRGPPPTTGPFSPTRIPTQPTSPTYHAHPYAVPSSWEGNRHYPPNTANYPYASYPTSYGCTCSCTPLNSSTPVPISSSMPQESSEI